MAIVYDLRSGFVFPNGKILYTENGQHLNILLSFFNQHVEEENYLYEKCLEFSCHPDIECYFGSEYIDFLVQCMGCIKVGAPNDDFYTISVTYPGISKNTKNKLTLEFIKRSIGKYRMLSGDYTKRNSDRLVYLLYEEPYYGDLIDYDENKGFSLIKDL